ncbi:MAG TPA: hypothetical protein VGN37_17430 [Actinocatenispora sp.]
MEEIAYCSDCRAERIFERPDCPDGHGADCPERCCTHCGAAVLLDPPYPLRRRPSARRAA